MEHIVNIGQSVQIKGELSGNEDLTIEGSVDGKIMLKEHNLTIGANGRITAEISAKTVVVIGKVTGNITASDRVEVSETGVVRGDIRAPRVALSDGSTFKGSIDMERTAAKTPQKTVVTTPARKEMPAGATMAPPR
jgi:cytoskeletal protein CcmA (bactofilin family)